MKTVVSTYSRVRVSYVHPTAVIGDDVTIGEGTRIGPYCVIDNADIGTNCVIDANVRIGGPGFGYDRVQDGRWLKKMEIHGVVIGDNVDIGANTVIARGSYRDTIIGDGCKLDAQVFVAHNVHVGRDCLLIAHSELSGSVTVGDGCWIAPHATVREHITIGANVTVGLGAAVVKDVPAGATVAGVPARPIPVAV